MGTNRELGLDLLRILAAFQVVLIHISAPFVTKNMKALNELFWAGNLFDSFSRMSVPVFVLISGYFILKPVPNLRSFYKKRFTRIAIPFLVWGTFFILWSLFFDNITEGKLRFNLYWGKPYFHLWYLSMLMGLYTIAPFISDFKQRVGEKSFIITSVVLLLIGMCIDSWHNYTGGKQWMAEYWLPYLGYFMLGSMLDKLKSFKINGYVLLFLILASWMIAFFMTGVLFKSKIYSWYFYSNLSLPVIVSSIAIVLLFMRIKGSSGLVYQFSELTFGIYLIHVIPITIFSRYNTQLICGNAYLHILVLSLGVLLVSGFGVWVLRKVAIVRRHVL